MIQRLRKAQEDRQGGFTLIELLVVILIIAILAAIAIPFFLNQREKGYIAQQESALKNAATSMETVATEFGGDYTAAGAIAAGDVGADLSDYGYRNTTNVVLTVDSVSNNAYCLTATHANLTAPDNVYSYDVAVGEPVAGNTC